MFSTQNSEGAGACVSVFSVYKTVVSRTFIYSFNTSLTSTYFVYIKNASHIEQLCPKSVTKYSWDALKFTHKYDMHFFQLYCKL